MIAVNRLTSRGIATHAITCPALKRSKCCCFEPLPALSFRQGRIYMRLDSPDSRELTGFLRHFEKGLIYGAASALSVPSITITEGLTATLFHASDPFVSQFQTRQSTELPRSNPLNLIY